MVSHFEEAGLGVDYARVVHNSSGGENVDEMVDGMCARMGDVVGGGDGCGQGEGMGGVSEGGRV